LSRSALVTPMRVPVDYKVHACMYSLLAVNYHIFSAQYPLNLESILFKFKMFTLKYTCLSGFGFLMHVDVLKFTNHACNQRQILAQGQTNQLLLGHKET